MSLRYRMAFLAHFALLSVVPNATATSISFVDTFKNLTYGQTSNASATATGGFFSSDINTNVANPYTSASMTFPGPSSPLALTPLSPTDYHYQSGGYATKTDLDTAFPAGTYTFSGTDGVNTDTTSVNYSADFYAQSIPFLTGTDFADLQGMNATQAFTFHINPFVTGSGVNSSFVFFTIFDYTTNSFVFEQNFLPSSTTNIVLPGNTLTAGHSYGYEIDFSNRVLTPSSPAADFDAQLGFEVRTSGLFSANTVPEPVTAALIGVPLMALLLVRRRK